MLSDEQIENFQSIYRKYFEKEISKEEAIEKGLKLVHLIKILTKK